MTTLQRSTGDDVRRMALLSACGTYRYELRRTWDVLLPVLRWIMLNPSTADALLDDPTIRRCIGFARALGFGGIIVHNLFALRATNPAELRRHPDPVGIVNNAWLLAGPQAAVTVAAWGTHGALHGRDRQVLALLGRRGVPLHHLGTLTAGGHPRHPLYLPATTPLNPFPLLRA